MFEMELNLSPEIDGPPPMFEMGLNLSPDGRPPCSNHAKDATPSRFCMFEMVGPRVRAGPEPVTRRSPPMFEMYLNAGPIFGNLLAPSLALSIIHWQYL